MAAERSILRKGSSRHSAGGVRGDELEDEPLARWAQRLRRLALGCTVALITARAFWPSEPDPKTGAGDGLVWILWLLITAGVAIASSLIGGRFRCRLAWADLGVVMLVLLVATSASQAVDRGPALNLAWEWVALGVAYLLLRNLPSTPAESSALVGCLFATSIAVAVYGLYQGFVELPALKAQFVKNPLPMLEAAHVQPGTPAALLFRDRLLYSSEIFSTFGLANSFAGFLIGPLVIATWVWIEGLIAPAGQGSRLGKLLAAAPLILIGLAALELSKSRSAAIGYGLGIVLLGWRVRRLVSRRGFLVGVLAAGLLVLALVGAGFALGRLDWEVLSQTPLSLKYRMQYWRGAWGVITEGSSPERGVLDSTVFWHGVGPGNFAAPYLRHKLPEASEEILDPHNLFLEVWATAGVFALIALAVALGLALWHLLRSSPAEPAAADQPPADWLYYCAGFGWLVVVLIGRLNPFEGDLFSRWLILGAGYLTAVLLSRPLWTQEAVPAAALGAGVAGLVLNLCAAGGIGIPTVALELWAMTALGLNLLPGANPSRLRTLDSRLPALGLAFGYSALLGSFLGVTIPYWRFESYLAAGDQAMRSNPPNYEQANAAYEAAIKADPYDSRPWLGIAYVQAAIWESRGAKAEDETWKRIPIALLEAVKYPRNSHSWSLHRERAEIMSQLLARLGPKLDPRTALPYQANIVEATRRACLLYPTNADLHARLALASAGISMYADAVREAEEALRLDSITPHPDKKLSDATRDLLKKQLANWKERAASKPEPATR